MPRLTCLALCGLIGSAGLAEAGMPGVEYTISEAAKLRLETLSFLLAGFFLAAGGVRWLWNSLTRDFPGLPLLSYGKALALVALWGLLFVLVLTMISGARELLTPGAWEQNGITSRLNQP
jgi:hypothetical protein